MKILTLTQPWASLVAWGVKRYETRSWSTSFRGPLGIHAAKGFPRDARFTCLENDWICDTLVEQGIDVPDLPLGCIIAVVDVVSCIPTGIALDEIDEREAAFGNYDPGRWAWELRNVRRLPEPIPAKGALGLWTFDHPALDALVTAHDASAA